MNGSAAYPQLGARIGSLIARTGESWGISTTNPSRKDFMSVETGTVKWFNESKGYGFIAQDAGGADLFAHFRDIEGSGFKTLTENQRVQFEVKQGQKGLQAANIKPL